MRIPSSIMKSTSCTGGMAGLADRRCDGEMTVTRWEVEEVGGAAGVVRFWRFFLASREFDIGGGWLKPNVWVPSAGVTPELLTYQYPCRNSAGANSDSRGVPWN